MLFPRGEKGFEFLRLFQHFAPPVLSEVIPPIYIYIPVLSGESVRDQGRVPSKPAEQARVKTVSWRKFDKNFAPLGFAPRNVGTAVARGNSGCCIRHMREATQISEDANFEFLVRSNGEIHLKQKKLVRCCSNLAVPMAGQVSTRGERSRGAKPRGETEGRNKK